MQIPAQAPAKPVNKAKATQKAMAAAPTAQTAQVAASKAAKTSQNSPASSAMAPKMAKNDATASIPRSYVMVVSSYENVARNSELTGDAAEQLGKTIESRINELNKNALRDIQDLPEYKKLDIENIKELGEEIGDMLTDEEDSMKAFALLKNPVFANLMESTENVHRSFAEMMQDNGEEKLLFGALQTATLINDPKSTSAVSLKA